MPCEGGDLALSTSNAQPRPFREVWGNVDNAFV